MKKKIIAGGVALALVTPLALGLAGCKDNRALNINAKDIYAMSAASSASYLQELGTNKTAQLSKTFAATELTRPNEITNENVDGMKNCLTMFSGIIQNGGITQDTNKNTESSRPDYNFVMSISVPGFESFKMYYNEIATEENREIEDEEEEVEVSTTLAGIMVAGDQEFNVEGKRVFEQEGDETEATIEFKTIADEDNYIVVEQSVENNEIEYEYKIVKDGKTVQETEIEFEQEKDNFELEFQFKKAGVKEETVYEVKKGKDGFDFEISYIIGESIHKINVKTLETDGYEFTYENGYTEIVK